MSQCTGRASRAGACGALAFEPALWARAMSIEPLLIRTPDAPVTPAERPAAVRSPWTAYAHTVGLYLVTLWAVVTLVFVLPRALPGDPLQSLDDPESGTYVEDNRSRELVAAYYGLDKPLLSQYRSYLGDLADGELGWSISQKTPVSDLIGRRLPWTLLLVGSSLALASIISFLAGMTAAWRRGSVVDKALIVSLSTARAIPEYAIASMLLIGFAVFYPVLPMAGGQRPCAEYRSFLDAAADIFDHAVLPVSALTIGLVDSKFLIVRNTAIATLGEDYMLLARAKGLPPRLLKYRHSGRNVMLPFLTALGVQVGFAVSASLFVETVFAYPGIGTLINSAVTARDYPLLQGTFLMLALAVIVANFVVDMAYRWLDPRTG